MEKRDPLREVANASSNNESQEAVDDIPKQPEPNPVADNSSDNKENGFSSKVQKSDDDKSDIGSGSSKPKDKPRRSILKTFDPLYCESPEKFDPANSSKSVQRSHPQLTIEEIDESENAQIEVSDDDTTFVDACTAPDEASSENQIINLHLEESLLKFETPVKVHVTQESSDSESPSTSEVADNKSVLTNIETSTSSSDQSRKETLCSTLPSPNNTEFEIVSAIHRKLSDDCSTIPARSKFTLTKTEFEACDLLKERLDVENRDTILEARQEHLADAITTNSLTSICEIRNVSPERCNVSLENETRNEESALTDEQQQSENKDLEVTETAEKVESSDDSQESEIIVIEKKSEVEINLGEKKESTLSDINKEETEHHILLETETESPSTEPSISNETRSSESHICTEDVSKDENKNIEKDESSGETNKLQAEGQQYHKTEKLSESKTVFTDEQIEKIEPSEEKVYSHSEERLGTEHKFEPELEDKQTDEQKSSEEESKLQSEENGKDLVDVQPKLEDKPAEKQDSEKEQSKEQCVKLETHLEPDCEIEFKPASPQEYKDSEKSETCPVSDFKTKCEFNEKPEEPQTDLEPNSETNRQLEDQSEIPLQHLESNCEVESEIQVEKSEGEERNCESSELGVSNKEVGEAPNTSSEIKILVSSEQATSEEKTCELEAKIIEIQKPDTKSPVIGEESDIYVQPDEEHHVDSGLDSIEESYTKSPKSQEVDSEDSERGEEVQISPEKEDCLLDKKLNHTNDEPKIKKNSDEGLKILADVPVQDEQPQLLVELVKPKTDETRLVDEPTEPEIERVTLNLTDNQKSVIKTSAEVESFKSKMADLSEKLNEQQQENSDLKLQLNAIQQAKASLELEIRQKEEVIIKTQAEALKNEQTYKQEIKQLREKLKENSKLIEKDGSKELEDQLKEAKAREAKAVAELNQRTKDDLNYQKIMEEYENTIATRFADYQKLKEEHETATRHLANIELAFSDVHQKYERTKALLEGFKSNEEALNAALQASEKTCKQHEERYESLKAHAKGQIEKSNKEILMLRDKYEMDINKLKAIIKRLEIKCSSLEVSLQQKTEECAALSALCDEVTGKKV